MNLFDVLFAKKLSGGGSPFPPVIKRVTGNPIEFTDGADAPLVKCVTQITGSQDLHGQDKPWVGGAGKNKLVMSLSWIKNNNTTGTWSGNTYTKNGNTFDVLVDSAENVIGFKVKGTPTTGNTTFSISTNKFDVANGTSLIANGCPTGSDGTRFYIAIGYVTNFYASDRIFTYNTASPQSTTDITIVNGYTAPSDGIMFIPMIRLATETDPTFAPYSNICPITAYTENTILAGGHNIWDGEKEQGDITAQGVPHSSSARQRSVNFIAVSPDRTYYCNAILFRVYYDKDFDFVLYDDSGTNTFTPPANAKYLKVFASNERMSEDICINYPATVTNFEPYAVPHTTTYPSAIYRGSEDVVNGEVTSEMPVIDLDALTPNTRYTGTINKTVSFTLPGNYTYNSSASWALNCISEQFEYKGKVQGASALSNPDNLDVGIYAYYASGTGTINTIYLVVPVGTTTYGKFAYELATPTTSSVTPTNLPIKSLSGYNHIESSTGDMTIDYITEGYQNFVDTVESALPNTRKGGVKAFDIFKTLDEPKKPEASAEESEPEEKETEEGAKK